MTPGRQREGIGRAIVERLVDEARADGLTRVSIGGGVHYLFPGVPVDVLGMQPFFEALGARFEDKVYDVRTDLDGKATGDRERAALAKAGLVVRPMDPMEDEAAPGAPRSGVRARLGLRHGLGLRPRDGGGRCPAPPARRCAGRTVAADMMLGLAVLHQRGNRPLFGPRFWEGLLEPSSGGLGPIGIVERLRGRGIGRALLAAGLDTLHARGVRDCVIDWTTLLDFYGAFGFRPWKAYIQGELPL